MSAVRDHHHFFTPEEYFLWEEQQLEKHELIDGQVCPLVRGSNIHSRIAVKLTALLDNHLEDASYIIGNSDLRVNITNPARSTDRAGLVQTKILGGVNRKCRLASASDLEKPGGHSCLCLKFLS